MSRRSRLTCTFTIVLPLPAGATAKHAELFVRSALGAGKSLTDKDSPMQGYSFEQTIIRLTERKTEYV